MLNFLLALFFIFSPFTSYFALSGWLRLPVVILLIIYLTFTIKTISLGKISSSILKVKREDVILLLFLLLVWVSLGVGFYGIRSLNHSIAYSFTILLYFLFFKVVLLYQRTSLGNIYKYLTISSWICFAIIIVDWILVNGFAIQIRDTFVSIENGTANMLYYKKQYFTAVSGVAEEPGSMAFHLNIIAPIGILNYSLKEKTVRLIFLQSHM